MITVLVADDHPVMRDGLRAILQAQGDITVVAAAEDGSQALALVARHSPDIALLDIAMPGLSGIEVAQRLHQGHAATRVIILSMRSDVEFISAALRAGVHGYLLKQSTGAEIADAIRCVQTGRHYFSQAVTELMAVHLGGDGPEPPDSRLTSLSLREREVLQLVAEGKTSAVIAKRLYLSPKTIETYRSRLMRKLELHDRSELVRFAIQHGLIRLDYVRD